ncbi:hypothetical protein FF38_06897 [Lucilia cuprina]|uniref:Uncharacterized protein n=1 Tax=Lucilia cuprina TaxID=7375 RepID=A0A0L0BKN2_LUCCU|nr:hypothetical protein FF38_06897 [Lucilia cuprina]
MRGSLGAIQMLWLLRSRRMRPSWVYDCHLIKLAFLREHRDDQVISKDYSNSVDDTDDDDDFVVVVAFAIAAEIDADVGHLTDEELVRWRRSASSDSKSLSDLGDLRGDSVGDFKSEEFRRLSVLCRVVSCVCKRSHLSLSISNCLCSSSSCSKADSKRLRMASMITTSCSCTSCECCFSNSNS